MTVSIGDQRGAGVTVQHRLGRHAGRVCQNLSGSGQIIVGFETEHCECKGLPPQGKSLIWHLSNAAVQQALNQREWHSPV
ncbi:hypothetical protein [Cupriavidus lacunae]|uniref:hypothetical protein n=1 Tax=Cupriavidus lacunae TaxID=2666307 RepID=UPI001374D3A4|nr:hypothetical protein [Cupriavidus lacunae]